MGGVIGFTLRIADGTEYRMSRWTNWSPWAIDNIGMVHKSPQHVEAVLHEWIKQKDWPDDKKNWSYHEPFLAPSQYGLVVVDFLNNKILDCNGYHAFGKMGRCGLSLDFKIEDCGDSDDTTVFSEEGTDAYRFYQFFKEKRIKHYQMWQNGKKHVHPTDFNSLTPKELAKFITKYDPESDGFFILDMSPFEVTRFQESPEGWKLFRQAVLDLGFKLTDEEEEIWNEAVNKYSE